MAGRRECIGEWGRGWRDTGKRKGQTPVVTVPGVRSPHLPEVLECLVASMASVPQQSYQGRSSTGGKQRPHSGSTAVCLWRTLLQEPDALGSLTAQATLSQEPQTLQVSTRVSLTWLLRLNYIYCNTSLKAVHCSQPRAAKRRGAGRDEFSSRWEARTI